MKLSNGLSTEQDEQMVKLFYIAYMNTSIKVPHQSKGIDALWNAYTYTVPSETSGLDKCLMLAVLVFTTMLPNVI